MKIDISKGFIVFTAENEAETFQLKSKVEELRETSLKFYMARDEDKDEQIVCIVIILPE